MQISDTSPYASRRSPVMADNIVATSQPLAAQAGLSMLARGGNAMDAALATAIALTVVEPTGNGIGSDAFAIIWDGSDLHGLNASGRSAAGWHPERFAGRKEMPVIGWESVTVPGAVSSWVTCSERFGKLSFATLFEPAIRYAESGFPVSPIVSQLWAREAERLKHQPGFSEAFLPQGRAPLAGEYFQSVDQARSLQRIAETNGRAFYEGQIAEEIIAAAQEHEAALTLEDLAQHSVEWCGTISRRFDDAILHEIPPNGQGIAALMALGILSHTPIRDLGAENPMAMHLQIEAMKLALRDAERFVADPDHMTEVTVSDLLDDAYLSARAQEIDLQAATDFASGAPRRGGTVYLTAADESGMMVSFIQSNYEKFGSGVVVPGTGIALQNRGAGFSLDPRHPNVVGPGKRPFHTIIPGFLMGPDGPLMSFGVMGGPMQAQGHVQMLLRTQLFGQDPQTAVDAPRWRVTEGLGVAIEPEMSEAIVQALQDLGHRVTLEAPDAGFGFGGAQIIHRLQGRGYIAGSDPRKDGAAIGF
ncbi:MAG: gamma-glutamyltransferase family protein [Pseudomonadota bacterium]